MHPILFRLLVFTLGVLLVSFLPVAVPGKKSDIHLGMTLEDLLAVSIQGPFLALALWWLFRALPVPAERRPLRLDLLMVAGLFLFFAGFGVHWAANSVHGAMDRALDLGAAHDHPAPGPAPAYALVYFYDEHLGHQLTYLGFFALLLAGCWLQLLADTGSLARREMGLLALAALAGGFGGAVSALEGQTAIEGIVLSGGAALGLFALMRRRGESWARRPVVAYTVTVSLLVILLELAWFARFGGLYQPSELFGV